MMLFLFSFSLFIKLGSIYMLNVMIVDDFKVFITQLRKLDVWKKYSDRFDLKFTFTDSCKALETLRTNSVDVLITDIKMPGFSGIDLLRKVRDEKLCRCTVLMSEYTDFEFAHDAIILGAFDYIVKPVSGQMMAVLLDRIHASLSETNELEVKSDDAILLNVGILMDSIIAENDNFSGNIRKLMKNCRDMAGENVIRYGFVLSKTADILYKKLECIYPWIRHITYHPRKLKSELTASDDLTVSESLFTGFCNDLFAAVRTYHPSGMNELVQNAVDYILMNYSRKLKLSEVADVCYVNQSHLSHSFKLNMGMSFVDYVVQYKMQILRMMLSRTDMNISDIAEELGYIDGKYMSRLFKNTFGMTISDYKSSLTGLQ